MRFDERILTYFESCDSPVDKEGYLYKKGERNTSYQKRWCVLKGNLLFYKDRPGDKDLIGVIVLEGCTVQLCESEEKFAFSLVWSQPGLRTYKFAAEDEALQESWIKALLSANHNYLALLLMDLEKQYREARKTHSSNIAQAFVMPNFSTEDGKGLTASTLDTGTMRPAMFPGPGLAAAPGLSSATMLEPTQVSSKSVKAKSPKLWPKRNASVAPFNATQLPMVEWSAVELSNKEEFSQLHADFGKEVLILIAEWSKKNGGGDGVVKEEDLIDFG